jgi:hypothetical protein
MGKKNGTTRIAVSCFSCYKPAARTGHAASAGGGDGASLSGSNIPTDSEAMNEVMPSAREAGSMMPESEPAKPNDGNNPADFIPLRLVLKPSGTAVEMTRPEMIVGRHSGADVRLPMPDVSRRHCRFVFGNGSWQVVDLNSLNGVYVNGERVQQADLHDGDWIGIGAYRFEVELHGGPSLALATPPAQGEALRQAQSLTHLALEFDKQRRAS